MAWYRTHSEQFQAALTLIHGAGPAWMLAGSASLTRRDLGDYDPTLDAALAASAAAAPVTSPQAFFDTLWNDRGPPGIEHRGRGYVVGSIAAALLGVSAHGVGGDLTDLSSSSDLACTSLLACCAAAKTRQPHWPCDSHPQ